MAEEGGWRPPLVLEPTRIAELARVTPTQLAAGKRSSAVVTSAGEAWSWGDGASGKLGHGGGRQMNLAAPVESLIGRSDVASVALADNHTLFVGKDGAIWSCGENKEGQLG